MTLENDDKFVVSRSGDNYSVEQQNLMANLEDTDLMLVSRAGTNYKITGVELKDSLGPSEIAPVMDSVILAADAGNTNRFTDATYNATLVMNPEGNPVPTKALKAEVRGQLSVKGKTGEIVGISGNTLTLASDANLANGAFKAGDAVKQDNSPIVPTSSEITNVGEVGTARLFTSSTAPANLADALTKTEITYQSQVNLGIGEYLIIVPEYNATGQVFTTNGTANFSYNSGSSADIGSFESDGTALGGYGSYNDLEWVAQNYTTDPSVDLTSTAYVIPSYAGGYTVFEIGTAGTTGVISGATSLTLQNASGLSDFEVGDVVQSADGITTYSNKSRTDTVPNSKKGDKYRIDINDLPTGSDQYNLPQLFGGFPDGLTSISSACEIWGFPGKDSVGGSSVGSFNFTETKTAGEWYIQFSQATAYYYVSVTGLGGSSYPADGTDLGKTGSDVAVIAINEAIPSINTDGGSWLGSDGTGDPDGETFVTGPTTDITATFVSADPSVPSMTVSDVVGPWSANTGNTVVNTVTNPVYIKPETSAITVVDGDVLSFVDDTDLNNFSTGDSVYVEGASGAATFAPVIYTGNGGTQSITTGMAPDFVWIKQRTGTEWHYLFDTIRGATDVLYSNDTRGTGTAAVSLTSFNADGFTLGSDSAVNGSADYIAWCWSAGGTTVTNDEGTATAQVRSNGTFSIAYIPTSVNGFTYGHGLTNKPDFILLKSTVVEDNWQVYHKDLGTNLIQLNQSSAKIDGAYWGTIDYKTVDAGALWPGITGEVVTYNWAESPTQSFGEYTGTSAEQTVTLGFAPAFVLIKSTTTSEQWYVYDSARQTSSTYPYLNPNLSSAEGSTGSRNVELTDSGFTIIGADGAVNGSGLNYIYAAFAGGGGPTGVVGDITGLDMTLSESSGTWEVGQTVTMDEKEQVISTLYCEIDTIGNVTGLSSTDPGYTDQASNATTQSITFPTQFPTGNTPDVDLPEGTSLKVSAKATNDLGTSSATSNTLFPTE